MKLTLYRGDAVKIKEFELKKTNKWCLLGQGIYLTNSLSVANTYRDKNKKVTRELFRGYADNRTEALEQGFELYCKHRWEEVNIPSNWYSRLSDDRREKWKKSQRESYREMIEEKRIVAEYIVAPISTALRGGTIKPSSTIAWQKELNKKHKKYLVVRWDSIPNYGYVTQFEFEEQQFNTSMFHVDKACNDDFFWTLMYDAKAHVGRQAENLDEYLRLNKGTSVYRAVDDSGLPSYDKKNVWKKIGNILEPYGFHGFEYNGGARLGGGHKHRAFSVWDEDFVNKHKVERFK